MDAGSIPAASIKIENPTFSGWVFYATTSFKNSPISQTTKFYSLQICASSSGSIRRLDRLRSTPGVVSNKLPAPSGFLQLVEGFWEGLVWNFEFSFWSTHFFSNSPIMKLCWSTQFCNLSSIAFLRSGPLLDRSFFSFGSFLIS